jgi:hypothetical protein
MVSGRPIGVVTPADAALTLDREPREPRSQSLSFLTIRAFALAMGTSVTQYRLDAKRECLGILGRGHVEDAPEVQRRASQELHEQNRWHAALRESEPLDQAAVETVVGIVPVPVHAREMVE